MIKTPPQFFKLPTPAVRVGRIGKLEDTYNLKPGSRVDKAWKQMFPTGFGMVQKRENADWLFTPTETVKRFGLRAIEFGNWVNQGDRANFLYATAATLDDIAKIYKVKPEGVGLGGDLQLSFGARGNGGSAAAFFVPHTYYLINLTLTRGYGVFIHEFGHAIDQHLYQLEHLRSGKKKYNLGGFMSGGEGGNGTTTRKTLAPQPEGSTFATMAEIFNRVLFNPDGTDSSYMTWLIKTESSYYNERAEIWARIIERHFLLKFEAHGIKNKFGVQSGSDLPAPELVRRCEKLIDSLLLFAFTKSFKSEKIENRRVVPVVPVATPTPPVAKPPVRFEPPIPVMVAPVPVAKPVPVAVAVPENLDMLVKNWYIKQFPGDELGHEIRKNLTFKTLIKEMKRLVDVYVLLQVSDSLVRERVFEKLAKLLNVSYKKVYDLWLKGTDNKNKIVQKPDGSLIEVSVPVATPKPTPVPPVRVAPVPVATPVPVVDIKVMPKDWLNVTYTPVDPRAFARYRDRYDIFNELPDGWRLDNLGSPLSYTVSIINGSILKGGKRALLINPNTKHLIPVATPTPVPVATPVATPVAPVPVAVPEALANALKQVDKHDNSFGYKSDRFDFNDILHNTPPEYRQAVVNYIFSKPRPEHLKGHIERILINAAKNDNLKAKAMPIPVPVATPVAPVAVPEQTPIVRLMAESENFKKTLSGAAASAWGLVVLNAFKGKNNWALAKLSLKWLKEGSKDDLKAILNEIGNNDSSIFMELDAANTSPIKQKNDDILKQLTDFKNQWATPTPPVPVAVPPVAPPMPVAIPTPTPVKVEHIPVQPNVIVPSKIENIFKILVENKIILTDNLVNIRDILDKKTFDEFMNLNENEKILLAIKYLENVIPSKKWKTSIRYYMPDMKPLILNFKDFPISVKKISVIDSLKKIASTDVMRPIMTCVYKDSVNKKIKATDAFIAVSIDMKDINKNEFICKEQSVSDAFTNYGEKFPNFEAITFKDNFISINVSLSEWLPALNGLVLSHRFYTKYDHKMLPAVLIIIGENKYFFDSLNFFKVFNLFAEQRPDIDIIELRFRNNKTQIVATNNYGIEAIIMSRVESEVSKIFIKV